MNRNGYVSQTPPSRWEEAALCGNGTLGALAWCDPWNETLVFSHESLFFPQDGKRTPIDTAGCLGELRDLLASGRYDEAANRVVALGEAAGYKGSDLVWTDSFMPACDLNIQLDRSGPVRGYERSLSFRSGCADVQWTDEDGTVLREWFVSRADQAAVLRIRAQDGALLSGTAALSLHPPDAVDDAETGRDALLGRIDAEPIRSETGPAGGMLHLRSGFFVPPHGYACAARVVASDGTIETEADHLRFRSVTELVILFAIDYAADRNQLDPAQPAARLTQLSADFDTLLSRHLPVHEPVYNRLALHLGTQEETENHRPSSEEIRSSAEQHLPGPMAYETLFNAGRYHAFSSSGSTPPNLQGLWTGRYTVPWSSDYTQNGNTQTAIMGFLPGNMHEALLGYFSYQESLLPDYRTNAQRLYGCRGILMASRTSNHGLNNHFNDIWTHTFWTAGAAWAAHYYYDYWLYTGDDAFFEKRALPFMEEAALFYEDFLFEGDDGRWVFSPSYSPENHPANSPSQACVNATMDIAIARELFTNLLEGCRTLGIRSEQIQDWQRMLDKMPDYRINEDGALKEWCIDSLEDRYDHRHASHLYPLYYGIAPEFRSRPDLLEAAAQAYRLRMRYRKEELGIMAFGLIQMGLVAVHLGDADMVETLLDTLIRDYYYSNTMSSHDAGPETFNVDIAGGLPALLMETLVQSHAVPDESGAIAGYHIDLLPCLLSSMPDGRISGLRTRGGLTLSIEWKDGRLVQVRLYNPKGVRYTVAYNGTTQPATTGTKCTCTALDFGA